MTDRVIVYPFELPRSADFLQVQQYTMYALSRVMLAAIGSATWVDGLACTPGTGLAVNIGAGAIGSMQTMDQNGIALGGLALDTSTLMKIGINIAATSIALAAPSTAGQSINYLIEAQFQEADDTPIVLPYYNSNSPTSPFMGPGGLGTSQNTRRHESVALQLKAGAAAVAGTQPTPGADSGWVPLWIITVPYGTTTIAAGNIYGAPQAPFLGTKVQQIRTKLLAPLTLYVTATGNDATNNGLSVNTAFATIQAAVNALANNYDLNGYQATINVGAGTFTGAQVTGLLTGQTSAILIVGASSASTTIAGGSSSALQANSGTNVGIGGVTVTGASGVSSNSGANISINAGVVFGACTGAHILASGGIVTLGSSYTVSGSATSHFQSFLGGTINVYGSITITTSGSPTFSGAFCTMSGGQWSALLGAVTFAGSGASGPRYSATGGGFINTTTGNASYFPGSTAGSTGSGTNTGFYA